MTSVRNEKRSWRLSLASAVALPLAVISLLVFAVVRPPPAAIAVLSEVDNGTERVQFNGQIDIQPRIIEDTVFNGPTMLEMVIDFRKVRGVGKALGRQVATEAQAVIHRPLLPFDQFDVTFPYQPGADVASARTVKATISVSFNANTGLSWTAKLAPVPNDKTIN